MDSTGRPSAVHEGGSATLLPRGEVLLAGGANFSGAVTAAAELYNPATGQWTITGSMTSARRFHAAVLLPNGQVLAAGGQDPNFSSLSSAELFNPASGTWQATASMQDGRSIPAAEFTWGRGVFCSRWIRLFERQLHFVARQR